MNWLRSASSADGKLISGTVRAGSFDMAWSGPAQVIAIKLT
jgi:hypothetical protein